MTIAIPAECENPDCGIVWASRGGFNVGSGGASTMLGCKVGPCPGCGGLGLIPDGVYECSNKLLQLM